jgi:manganese transport protein
MDNIKKEHTSLSEVHGTVDIKSNMNFKRRLLAFLGPAYMVSVGYMDPGNWATDIAGGSQFGYKLIWVLLMSNFMALLLQSLSARLGIVRGRDLAQASRELFPRKVNLFLYFLAEIAIAACDLAEVLGMAIGLKLLFHIPLMWGVVFCALDTFLLLFLLHYGIRKMEAFIISLVALIGLAFVAQMILANPSLPEIMTGFIPSLPNDAALYIAIGIIGATVMPHNLYLHSALVQTRKIERTSSEIRKAIRFNILDSTIALNLAFFVNAAILILAASVFHKNGLYEVADIMDAHKLLEPLLGGQLAPTLFAIALICAGQSSTITGTLAGQIVMEGYLNLRIAPWIRRIITRLIAIIPALLTIYYLGENATGDLLILSQVILSLQLGFAVIPLIHFVSDKEKMGEFSIPKYVQFFAWLSAAIIVGLNVKLVYEEIYSLVNDPSGTPWYAYLIVPIVLFSGIMLLYITFMPILKRNPARKIPIPHGSFNSFETQSSKKISRVAISLDFTSTDEQVIPMALQQGGQNAHYLLIHVSETAGALFHGRDTRDYESQVDRENLLKYKNYLENLGYSCETKMGYGSPRSAIPNLTIEFNADLLVMGAHGHKAIKDFILGSTIDAVRHKLKIPILVVR